MVHDARRVLAATNQHQGIALQSLDGPGDHIKTAGEVSQGRSIKREPKRRGQRVLRDLHLGWLKRPGPVVNFTAPDLAAPVCGIQAVALS